MKNSKSIKVISQNTVEEYRFERSKVKTVLNYILALISFGFLKLENRYKLVSPKRKRPMPTAEEYGDTGPKDIA